MISIHFSYRGRVQGVWFRKTATEIACHVGVVGYVRNLPDGSVEAVVCGSPEAIEEFAVAVAARYRAEIQKCTRVPWEGTEVFARFEIRD